MIVFVDPKNFHMELYSTFFCLCHDPEAPVRYTIAICFYEVSLKIDTTMHLLLILCVLDVFVIFCTLLLTDLS
jgi:serine/threonine-protein phosphatase 4 regulatory subunit 4